ncbi:MAG: glucose-6-phosphate isomerase [Planctomycetales bacterium]
MDFEPIRYDPSSVLNAETGLTPNDLNRIGPELLAARDEVLADAELWQAGGDVPAEKVPLDAGFIELPERLLAEYQEDHAKSQLGHILATARRLSDQVDRVVLLGIGGSYMGPRALFEACCHPYHNELSRGERGRHPRLYFEGNNADNDALTGLRDLLAGGEWSDPASHWGIIVISKSGGTLETAVGFRTFLTALRDACGDDPETLSELVIPITGTSGRLFDLSQALGCADVYEVPEGIGGRFSILTAVGLLPAAIMGLDIVKLLEGAAQMNHQFRTAELGANPVLDYTAVCNLMEKNRGAHTRVLSTWGKGLEATGFWYDQLLAESLGKEGRGALPLTVVNTRDLHSRGQQHQQGARDKLITNVYVQRNRRDPVYVGTSDYDQDQLNSMSEKSVPDIMAAALKGTNLAYAEDQRTTTDLSLPQLDEASLGQFFQMMMLATVVEGRLTGINPYGQPGVEAYKKHMNAILRGE